MPRLRREHLRTRQFLFRCALIDSSQGEFVQERSERRGIQHAAETLTRGAMLGRAQRYNAQAHALLRLGIKRQSDFALRTAADASGRGDGLFALLPARPFLAHLAKGEDQTNDDSSCDEQP